MLRPIEFRGKTVHGVSKWIYGDLTQYYGATCIHSEIMLPGYFIPLAVFPESVQQFTGFHNKAGQKLFEGDRDEVGNTIEFSGGSWNVNGDQPLWAMAAKFNPVSNVFDKKSNEE